MPRISFFAEEEMQSRQGQGTSRNSISEKGLVWLNDEVDTSLPTTFVAWIKVGIPKDSHQ